MFLRNLRFAPLAFLPLVPMYCDKPYIADINFPLLHSFSLSPGFGEGVLTSCYTAPSEVPDREHLCRVVDGYEELGISHRHTYEVFGPLPGRHNPDHILAVDERPGYGATVVLDGGIQFEGCVWYSPSNSFKCDYKTTRYAVLTTNNSHTTWILRKMWDWGNYLGNTIGCAGGIVGVWGGKPITFPLLTGCADGPME
jgi:hypothetical protein